MAELKAAEQGTRTPGVPELVGSADAAAGVRAIPSVPGAGDGIAG
ncbi:hypothetical protein [Nonomuraea sp. NPDC050783]